MVKQFKNLTASHISCQFENFPKFAVKLKIRSQFGLLVLLIVLNCVQSNIVSDHCATCVL